jgi:uncharacterized protein involved in cysteine biosynthesis
VGRRTFFSFFLFLGQHRQKETVNKVCTLAFQSLPSMQYIGYPLMDAKTTFFELKNLEKLHLTDKNMAAALVFDSGG